MHIFISSSIIVRINRTNQSFESIVRIKEAIRLILALGRQSLQVITEEFFRTYNMHSGRFFLNGHDRKRKKEDSLCDHLEAKDTSRCVLSYLILTSVAARKLIINHTFKYETRNHHFIAHTVIYMYTRNA